MAEELLTTWGRLGLEKVGHPRWPRHRVERILRTAEAGAAGSVGPHPSGLTRAPPALPRRAGAGRPRPSGAGHALRSRRSLRSGKIGAAIPRRYDEAAGLLSRW